MVEPLFERIDSDQMPDHLKGKSPEEVHAYWVERERQIRAEAASNPPSPSPGAPPSASPSAPSPSQVPTPAGTMTPGQTATLIAGAKMVAAVGKEHWQRFLPQTEGIMAQMTPAQQMDANMWTTVYDKVVGMHVSELVKEARDAALRPPSMESSSPPSPPSAPRELTANELHVIDQLRRAGAMAMRKDAAGVSHQVPFDADAYRSAEQRAKTGAWPLTFNNY